MANTVNKVIKIAEAEVGYLEKESDKDLYDKTANAGDKNYTKYGKEMHQIYPSVMDYPAFWCDCFVDWCFYKAYGITNAKKLLAGDFNDYTIASADMYKKKNAWYTSNPKIGDQVFFKNSSGKICHTGLVYKVDSISIYTIEGNTSSGAGVVANGGCVAKKQYLLTYSRIAGYGRPKYDSSSTLESNTKTNSSKSIAPDAAKPTLKKGSSGAQVTLLQHDLNYVMNSGISVDGSFGAKTETALKAFQKKYGLTQDGIYGNASYKKIKSLLTSK
jgi:hypothetical protein